MSAAKNHPFHLVDPSPWPALGALAAFVTAYGAVNYMHDEPVLGLSGTALLLPGLLLVILTMIFWWRDVIAEGETPNLHTAEVRVGLRQGMIWFIASEVMFFAAFFWAFFHSALGFSYTVPQWPPEGIETFDPWHLPLYNTLILLTSGATITWAHHALKHEKRGQLLIGTALTVLLGFIFLGFQVYEYGHATFAFDEGIYPSVFYMATGFHGFHVFVGAVFLAVCTFRIARGHFTANHHVGFEAAAWYWHFVDVVWLFLFVWIYVWGA